MKIFVMYAVAVTVLCSVATSSFATLSIRPSISVQEKFDDNLFLTKTDREHDFITYIKPNLLITYAPNSNLDMGLNYGLNFRFYARHSELDTARLDETQNIRFQTQFKPTNRLTINVTDIYTRVPIDEQLNTTPENPFENMTSVNVFRITPMVMLPITSTLSTRLGYRYVNVWYDAEVSNNSDSHAAFASLTKLFPFRLSVSANYDYTPVRSEDTGDYERHEGSLSASYQVNERLSIMGGYGMTYVDYDNSVSNGLTVDPFTGIPISGRFFTNLDDDDQSFWNVGASYYLDMLGGTELSASYMESLSDSTVSQELWREEFKYIPVAYIEDSLLMQVLPTGEYIFDSSSTTSGLTKSKRFDVQIKIKEPVDLTINPYYRIEESLENIVFVPSGLLAQLDLSGEDEAKGISVSVSRPINLYGRVTGLSFGATYERSKYSEQTFAEKISRYSLGTSLSYSLSESIGLSGGYQFTYRNSDFDANDFRNNVAWIQARMSF